jgi:DNA-directed RNA polymerase beta subunit
VITFEDILAATTAVVEKPAAAHIVHDKQPDYGEDVPADIDTILASTEKLLAVTRGHAEPDERDSLEFRRILTPDKLLSERVNLDDGRVMRVLMMRLARAKSLKPLQVNHFDPYTEGMVAGHPLSSPLEEINPLHLLEQSRRVTQLGPGGLPADSITEESQNIHPSIFGFLAAIEGPESGHIGVDTRAALGTKIGSDGQIYQRFVNRHTGRKQWVSPSDLSHKTVGLPE